MSHVASGNMQPSIEFNLVSPELIRIVNDGPRNMKGMLRMLLDVVQDSKRADLLQDRDFSKSSASEFSTTLDITQEKGKRGTQLDPLSTLES